MVPPALLAKIVLRVDHIENLALVAQVCQAWRSLLHDPDMGELFALLSHGRMDRRALAAELLRIFPDLVSVRLPSRAFRDPVLLVIQKLLAIGRGLHNSHPLAHGNHAAPRCPFGCKPDSLTNDAPPFPEEMSYRERAAAYTRRLSTMADLWRANSATAASKTANYGAFPAIGWDPRRSTAWPIAPITNGLLFCSECGMCMRNAFGHSHLAVGDIVMVGREPGIVQHKRYNNAGKNGGPKVVLQLTPLLNSTARTGSWETLMHAGYEACQEVLSVHEKEYLVCDIDDDAFVALLDDETGECREDLRLLSVCQQQVADVADLPLAVSTIQSALERGDALVAVVLVVDKVAQLSGELETAAGEALHPLDTIQDIKRTPE